MKKLIFAMLLAFSSSLVMAQVSGNSRNPNNDPHKASSASYKPNDNKSNNQKPGQSSSSQHDNKINSGNQNIPMNKPGNQNKPGQPDKPNMNGAAGSHGNPQGGPEMNRPNGNAYGYDHNRPNMPNKPNMDKKMGNPPMPPVNIRPVPPKGMPLSYQEIESFLGHMNLMSFDSRKLSEAKLFIRDRSLMSSQIAQIVRELSFDSNRLAFAKYAYKFCIDPGNYYLVEGTLSFISSKHELRDYISRYY